MIFVELFCPVSQLEQANVYFLTSTYIVFILQYQRSETNVVLIVFSGVLYEVHAHTFTICYCRLGWISKAIYQSVTIHSKTGYNKCRLTRSRRRPLSFRSDDFTVTRRNPWFSSFLVILYQGNHDRNHKLYVAIVDTLY